MLVYRSLNFTYLNQPLVHENENAGVKEIKFHLFKPAFGVQKRKCWCKGAKISPI